MSSVSPRAAIVAFATLLALTMSHLLLAQTPGTGAISGIVLAPASRAIADASVTVVDQASGASRNTQTSAEGFFRITLLPPAHYQVRIDRPGFATANVADLQVTVSQTASINVALSIKAENNFHFRAEAFNVTNTPQFGNPKQLPWIRRSFTSESHRKCFVRANHRRTRRPTSTHHPARRPV